MSTEIQKIYIYVVTSSNSETDRVGDTVGAFNGLELLEHVRRFGPDGLLSALDGLKEDVRQAAQKISANNI